MVAGLGLASLAWSPTAQADPALAGGVHPAPNIDSPTEDDCADPHKFAEHITPLGNAKCGSGVFESDPQKSGEPIAKLVNRIVGILSWVAGVAAVIVMVVQGLRMVLSSGDSSAMANARNGIIYAIVGLAVAISAPHILGYILSAIGA